MLHPYKFYSKGMSGILFFIFASREPLILVDVKLESTEILETTIFKNIFWIMS